jgi:hypothetical protein
MRYHAEVTSKGRTYFTTVSPTQTALRTRQRLSLPQQCKSDKNLYTIPAGYIKELHCHAATKRFGIRSVAAEDDGGWITNGAEQ